MTIDFSYRQNKLILKTQKYYIRFIIDFQ